MQGGGELVARQLLEPGGAGGARGGHRPHHDDVPALARVEAVDDRQARVPALGDPAQTLELSARAGVGRAQRLPRAQPARRDAGHRARRAGTTPPLVGRDRRRHAPKPRSRTAVAPCPLRCARDILAVLLPVVLAEPAAHRRIYPVRVYA
ncbi:hypothetical protein B8281_12755 [Cellulosimicrobium sp. TH-20]|nr:hypothetical protein B8281_12755 [Cellulosimicrobium sp. TH-20]